MADLNGLVESHPEKKYLERLEKIEERLVRQQKEHTRSLVKAIEATQVSIESKIASLSLAHMRGPLHEGDAGTSSMEPELGSRGLTLEPGLSSRAMTNQTTTLTHDMGKTQSDPPGNVSDEGCGSLQLMPMKPATLKSTTPMSGEMASKSGSDKAVRFKPSKTPPTPTGDPPTKTSALPPAPSNVTLAHMVSDADSSMRRTFSLDFDDMEWQTTEDKDGLAYSSLANPNQDVPLAVRSSALVAVTKSSEKSGDKSGDKPSGTSGANVAKEKAQYNCRLTIRHLDLCMAPLIVLNFVMIFIQVEINSADIAANLGMIANLDLHERDARLLVFEILEHAFNAIFVLEILVRIAVGRLEFFRSVFNRIDALIVIWLSFSLYFLQLVSSQPANLSYLRLLRACRVAWTLYAVRASNKFENFRILTRSIITSLTALLWALIALGLIMMVVAIFISQSLNSFLLNPAENLETKKMLFDLYGSSSRSFYTLFLVTFSDTWQSYVDPLANNVSTVYSLVFSVYIVFVRFGMLHVIAALFVKDMLRVSEHDSHMMLRKNVDNKKKLRLMLEAQDKAGNGHISLSQLHAALADSKAQKTLVSLGSNNHELDFLFALLQDDNGLVICHELVDNIMSVQTRSRSMDVLTILNSTRPILHTCKNILEKCRQLDNKMEASMSSQRRTSISNNNKSASLLSLPPQLPSELCPKCLAAEKASKKKRLMVKLKIFMVLLRQKTTRLGHTLLCHSYQDYLFYRGHLKGEAYDIELQSNHEVWAEMFDLYRNALLALPCGHRLEEVYWIGSSAVPGLVAKPVLDMMITVPEEDLKDIVYTICLESSKEPWMAEHGKGLRFPIGFYMEGWGFLQMPHYQAHDRGLLECNVHIFTSGTKAAHDKIILVEYLKSPEGKEYKDKYSILKLSLELRYKGGQLDSANYNKEKNFLVSQIVEAAAAWDDARSPKAGTAKTVAAAAGDDVVMAL